MSLNGYPWYPGRPLKAECSRDPLAARNHAPQIHCTCGIYALKDPLPACDSRWRCSYGPSGEVYLWGTVVECSEGWRAEYAYPKRLVVTAPCDPLFDPRSSLSVEEVQSRFEGLTKYGADITSGDGIPVWTASSGYNPAGIKSLCESLARILARMETLSEILVGNASLCAILGPRELELLPLLCEGLTNHEIAIRMRLSTITVKNYIYRIFEKLRVSNRLELVQLLQTGNLNQQATS